MTVIGTEGCVQRYPRTRFARAGQIFAESNESHLESARYETASISFWANSRFGICVFSYSDRALTDGDIEALRESVFIHTGLPKKFDVDLGARTPVGSALVADPGTNFLFFDT